jgi:SAM-dependent methyltransferase
VDETLRRNRELWDAWTKIHVASAFYDVASFRNGERPIRVADYEREEVGSVEGRSLLHLQCHFGLDTLSWARLGATVTGIDFSEEALAAARGLAVDLNIPATFIVSDLYRLPDVLHEQFDIVYTSCGVLGWLPDIATWGRVAAHFVRPGGFLYLTEIHPVAQVFGSEGVEPGELRLAYAYWSHPEPLRFEVKGSYADREAPTERARGVRLESFAGRDPDLARRRRPPARVPPRIRFRQVADRVPRPKRGRTMALARRLDGRPPALLLAQGHQAWRLIDTSPGDIGARSPAEGPLPRDPEAGRQIGVGDLARGVAAAQGVPAAE